MDNLHRGEGSNPKKKPLKQSQHKGSNPNPNRRRIPGPAGDFQAALETRERGKVPETEYLPTQEWLDRVADEPQYDDSFNQKPWQKAIEMGYDCFEGYTNFAEVRSQQGTCTSNRVPLSMGIVTSMKQSDDGVSLMVELKDHTGSKMMASINRTAIEQNFYKYLNVSGSEIVVGKGLIVPGSVIVMGDVAVFNPSSRGHPGNMYFNVVKRNLKLLVDVHGVYHEPAR